jgi:hypothetical protein
MLVPDACSCRQLSGKLPYMSQFLSMPPHAVVYSGLKGFFMRNGTVYMV